MDDDDRDSNSSENDDEVMEDVDMDNDPDQDQDGDPDNDAEDDDNDDNDGDDDDADDDGAEDGADDGDDETQDQTETQEAAVDSRDPDGGARTTREDGTADDKIERGAQSATSPSAARKSATPGPAAHWLPAMRPEVKTAKVYDVVPTMAAPQATSINAIAITPDLRYWMTGGSDGYVRKYSGPETINGKQLLTVAQRHPFVDSVVKAGSLISYWENEEAPGARGAAADEQVTSPVYSLAVHSQALWLLSGTEGGGINLQTVRHDEGKRICCLKQHTSAVSVLTLVPDETSVLSGGWDKKILDWDLNTGQVTRSYEGSGQISAIELRPSIGNPFPAGALDEPPVSDTFSSDDRRGLPNGLARAGADGSVSGERDGSADIVADVASPAHESLFGGSDAGSLFGDTMGGGFGGDDEDDVDDGFSRGLDMSLEDSSMNAGAGDVTMGGMDGLTAGEDAVAATAAQGDSATTATADAPGDAANNGPSTLPDSGDSNPKPAEATSSTDNTQGSAPAPPPPASQEKEPASSPANIPPPPSPPAAAVPPAPQEATEEQQQEKQPQSPTVVTSPRAPPHHDPSQVSGSTFLSASTDGTIRIWDRRAPHAVARITPQRGVPPWCMAACWSPSGNAIYAGRRNGLVEEFSVHEASRSWAPARSLKFPAVSGAVSAIRPMPNGRHLMCASHDILRLYDLEHPAAGRDGGGGGRESKTRGVGSVPFLIVPGPPRAGVISSLWIDPTCRFMISAAGTRGWEGTSTEVLIGYEISVP